MKNEYLEDRLESLLVVRQQKKIQSLEDRIYVLLSLLARSEQEIDRLHRANEDNPA